MLVEDCARHAAHSAQSADFDVNNLVITWAAEVTSELITLLADFYLPHFELHLIRSASQREDVGISSSSGV